MWASGWGPVEDAGLLDLLPRETVADLLRLRSAPRGEAPELILPAPVDGSGEHGPTAGQARGPHWRRTSTGRYVPSGRDAHVSQPAQRIAEAAGWCPDSGGVTGWASLHLAGARWFGGTAADGASLPVPLVLGPFGKRRRTPGALPSREQLPPREITVRHGVRSTVVERAVFDQMRIAGSVREAVVALEMALFAELTSLRRFGVYVSHRPAWTGVGGVREAHALAVEGSESPQEVRMRLVYELDAGLPRPLVNRDVFGPAGELLGRPDIFDPIAGLVGEYDGGHHRLAAVRSRDVSREEVFRAHGLEYFSVVEGDLPRREMVVERMRRARDRALRSQEPARWTLRGADGLRPLTLDRRLDLRDLIARYRSGEAPTR